MLDILLPTMNGSLFGVIYNNGYYQRQHWTVPRVHDYVPRNGVETKHPLLILSTTYDPVSPLVSARSANKAFVGSKIVEVKGYGHCSVSSPSICLARHVRDYLSDGKLPDSHTKCEIDGGYFTRPDKGNGMAKVYFEDPEERRIHQAQVELARDIEWPIW
jgi:hypothetical protein